MNRTLLAATAVVLATTTAVTAANDLYPCALAQPGARLWFPDDREDHCSLGFLFRGSDGHTYGATNQACATMPNFSASGGPLAIGGTNEFVGERRWSPGKGRVVEVKPTKERLGTVVYQRVAAADTAIGLTLVRIDRGVRYDGTVCGITGPNAIERSTASTPQPVWHPAMPTVAPAYDPNSPFRYIVPGPSDAVAPFGFANAETVVTSISGNGAFRGMPVLAGDDGALGIWTGGAGAFPQFPNVERIGPAIARAEKFLGIRLTLLRGGMRGRAN